MRADLEHRGRLLALSAMGLVFCGCGGGEGDTTSTEVSVEGSWSGTYAPAGATYSRPVYALIQKQGAAFFYDDDGVLYRLPSLDGHYTFAGDVQAFAPIGYGFGPAAPDPRYSIRGAAADSGITGELHNSAGTGRLELTPLGTFRKIPGVIPGQWTGYYITPTPFFVGLVVDAQGRITGDDVFGCHLVGRIQQHRAGEDLFEVTLVTTGPKPMCGVSFTGLAHQADYDTLGYFKQQPGTYYYLGMVGPSSAFAAEFKLQ